MDLYYIYIKEEFYSEYYVNVIQCFITKASWEGWILIKSRINDINRLPESFFKKLNLKNGDNLEVKLKEGGFKVKKITKLESLFASLKIENQKEDISINEARDIISKEIAKEYIEKFGK